MNKQSVLIFKLPELFNILNELKSHLNFAIHLFVEKDKLLEFKKTNTGSYLILTDSENEIKERVKTLGKKITEDYEGKRPIFIGILNGCYVFMADLLREVKLDVEVDFVKIRSYEGDSSTGTIKFRKDISADIDGRDIIIVEDIIDSGFTINFLVNRLRNSGPKSVAVASILFKKEVAKLDFEVDYIGFEIPPEFVVGYGLDYDEKYRHLKDVMVLEPKDLD